MTTTTTSSSTCDLSSSLQIVELKPGLRFSKQVLRDLLPDIETALFFGKVYELDARQLGVLIEAVCDTPLARALLSEGAVHSSDLQDYLVDDLGQVRGVDKGRLKFSEEKIPAGEILPHLWEQMEVEVAASIKAVAEKLAGVIDAMPGKQGAMAFKTMAVMNSKRPTIGDTRAWIHHPPQKQNLVILDVSGSMSEATVEAIVADVVSLSYMANAHFATVSNGTHHWGPGEYSVESVLEAAAYGGTHYETLSDLLNEEWGTVVTVADYDSSLSAKHALSRCTGHIDEVLDVSLVNRPTFLAECVGQKADKVRPILIAAAHVTQPYQLDHSDDEGEIDYDQGW